MSDILRLLAPFILAGIAGFIGWVWLLWRAHNDLRGEVAALRLFVVENYPKNGSFKELSDEVRHLTRVVIELAGKFGVQVKER